MQVLHWGLSLALFYTCYSLIPITLVQGISSPTPTPSTFRKQLDYKSWEESKKAGKKSWEYLTHQQSRRTEQNNLDRSKWKFKQDGTIRLGIASCQENEPLDAESNEQWDEFFNEQCDAEFNETTFGLEISEFGFRTYMSADEKTIITTRVDRPRSEVSLTAWPDLVLEQWEKLSSEKQMSAASLELIVFAWAYGAETLEVADVITKYDPAIIKERKAIAPPDENFLALLGTRWGDPVIQLLGRHADSLATKNEHRVVQKQKSINNIRLVNRGPRGREGHYDVYFQLEDVNPVPKDTAYNPLYQHSSILATRVSTRVSAGPTASTIRMGSTSSSLSGDAKCCNYFWRWASRWACPCFDGSYTSADLQE